MIITPGYTFSKAIFDAQKIYPDCKFVILDSAPQDDGAEAPEIAATTAAIDYAAQESGFVAGFACALQLKEGEFGALFGQEIPPKMCIRDRSQTPPEMPPRGPTTSTRSSAATSSSLHWWYSQQASRVFTPLQ